MSALRQALKDYLDIRRALGFDLRTPAWCLSTLVTFLEEQGASHITTAMAVRWAMQPPDGAPANWARRLGIVRQFAAWHRTMDPRTGSHDVEPADFGDTFHQARDFDTEAFFNARNRILRVFDGIMQKSGSQCDGIKTHIREDVGDFQEMREIRIARTAELIVMALRGNFIGPAYHPRIFGRAILAELFQQLVQASIELALGAVAMKMER